MPDCQPYVSSLNLLETKRRRGSGKGKNYLVPNCDFLFPSAKKMCRELYINRRNFLLYRDNFQICELRGSWHAFEYTLSKITTMNNLFRGLLAGAAAWKWGGGCLGTILVFVLVWMALGQCQ